MLQLALVEMVFESLAELTKRDPSSAEFVCSEIARHAAALAALKRQDLHLPGVTGGGSADDEEPIRRETVDPETFEVKTT